MDVSSSRKWASRGRKYETNPPSYLRSGLLVLKHSRISLRWDQRQQIKAWLKFFMPTFQVQHREHLFHVSQQCLQERNRKRGKILPTTGNMFLLVVHSQKQGRQMPLVKKSYLFCPWKRLKNNKRGFNKEEHDLKLLLPVFLPRRGRYPPSTWGHYWHMLYLKSHTIGSERTFHPKSCRRNPTKTRHTSKIILERFHFGVGRTMERNKNTALCVVWICKTWSTRLPTHMY